MRLRLALASSLACAALAALVATASAHSRPTRFDPAPGAVLQTAPAKVDGWFTAAIRRDPNWSFITVTDSQGNRVDTGDPILSSDRLQMTANLKPGLAQGRYLVTWRTWDDGDGAIFGDCYAFFVGQSAADQSVSGKARLDGGGSCARIDVSAKDATPVPSATLAETKGGGDDGTDMPASPGGSSGRVPWWTIVAGALGGLVIGGVGSKLVKGS